MNAMPLREITDAQVRQFWDDGAICLHGLYDLDWIDRIRAAIEENLAHPGPESREYVKEGEKGRFLGDIGIWAIKPEFRAYVFESPAAAIAARFLGGTHVNFFYDHLFVKEPGTMARTPWHQDQPYWPVKGEKVISIWLALDDVSLATSGMEYIKGSHRNRKWYKPRSFGGDASAYQATPGETIPDFDGERPKHEFLSWDMKAGDCIVHHALTVHGSPGNTSMSQRRRAYATRWVGDDTRYDPRPGLVPLSINPILLEPGDPMECEVFPRIWPR